MATVAVAGVTVTDATGARIVTVAVALFPPLVAVSVTVPGVADAATRAVTELCVAPPTEVTASIVTFVGSEDVQVTVRPESTNPAASRTSALKPRVPPGSTDAVSVRITTEATGAATVIDAVPVRPSLVAVIVAEPMATAVTSPVLETVALVVSDELHVTVRPVSVLLIMSRSVAVSCCVSPTASVAELGETETVDTGVGTVIVAVPLFPVGVVAGLPGLKGSDTVAVIVAVKPLVAAEEIVTSPVLDTVA